MSYLDFATGLLVLAGVVAPASIAMTRVRALLVPRGGSVASLAQVVLVLASVTVSSELVGTIGAFNRSGLVLGSVVLSIGVCLATRSKRRTAVEAAPDGAGLEEPGPNPRWTTAAELAIVALVAGEWLSQAWRSYQVGVTQFDSLAYHLPVAAQFAQKGWTTRLLFNGPDPIQAFHSENVEILHGIGMVAFGNDILSPIISFGWFLLALAGAWFIGRRVGLAPLTTAAVAMTLSIPVLVTTNGGSAGTDVAAVALLTVAVAFLEHEPRGRSLFLVGLAAGLAVGSKENAIGVAVALLAATLVTVPAGSRLRSGVRWVAAAALGGAYWFMRNLLRTGNPTPTLALGIGPFRLPTPALPFVGPNDHSAIEYLTNGEVLRRVFWPGIRASFGRGAVVIGLLLAIAVLIAMLQPGRSRLIGVMALVAAFAYLITPLTAFGPEGNPSPTQFSLNLRYLAPVFALAASAGTLALARLEPRARAWSEGLLSLVLAGTTAAAVFAEAGFSGWGVEGMRRIVVVAAVVALFGAVYAMYRLVARSTARVLAIMGGALLAVAGPTIASRYLDQRYLPGGAIDSVVATAGRQLTGQRIGVTGLQEAYPLYGARLDNEVQYIGVRLPHGGQLDFVDCSAWRAAVNRGKFQWVIVGQPESSRRTSPPPAAAWAATSGAAVSTNHAGTTELFRITGMLDPSTCPPS